MALTITSTMTFEVCPKLATPPETLPGLFDLIHVYNCNSQHFKQKYEYVVVSELNQLTNRLNRGRVSHLEGWTQMKKKQNGKCVRVWVRD
jgi:DNA polymerase/3'-5' exonuclease PolX